MNQVIMSVKLLTALLGLLLPGYSFARAIRLPYALLAAFPLSALLLCQSVTALTLTGSRITLPSVAAILITVTVASGLSVLRKKTGAEHASLSRVRADEPSSWLKPVLVTAGLILLAAAFRATLYPLGGFDTFTRWDALPREMLRHGALSFYPPISGADFSIYTMPDGFPPLVASVYWWLYAASGTVLPQLTAISVVLQLITILGLTWAAAETAFGEKAAALTLLAAVASPLLLRSVLIGQESGFLALAVAGQLFFALAAIRRPSRTLIYAAALFAALAALAREYGPALALPGLFILLSNPVTRRSAWRYVLLAAVVAFPWYGRNWLLTGSPLYPLTLPGSPHKNQLLSALMDYYQEVLTPVAFTAGQWLELCYELIAGGSIALLAALPYCAKNGRSSRPFTLSLAVIILLWIWSVGKTSGGVIYSLRVLAPAMVVLALIAGKALAELSDGPVLKRAPWLLVPVAAWSMCATLAFPLQPWQISSAFLSQKGAEHEFNAANREFTALISRLEIPATGILVDSPSLAVTLQRETRFRPVILWSSEASLILSRRDSARETAKLLQANGITLTALNRTSIHNNFLFTMPFYRDGVKEWREVTSLGNWVLFAFSPVNGR